MILLRGLRSYRIKRTRTTSLTELILLRLDKERGAPRGGRTGKGRFDDVQA